MEKFIIYLPKYENSVKWANNALNSGNSLGWNLSLHKGVDGTKTSLSEYNIRASKITKKCFRYMQRAGTIGCFLSHYNLWKYCVDTQSTISIFEHDVNFSKQYQEKSQSTDVLKYEGFNKAKPIPCGNWWEGARAYTIKPTGAKKLLDWVTHNGAMPADWMLCDGIVSIEFDCESGVTYNKNNFSFTKDLN